ncbi:MAG TPA: HupE/UreJ family protein [Phenylobacterium sp.]|uniref:HupE/UreJ family protein n=1 Tax=Phenylobacterium sp. TaxID=1871053 RepID=UPI002BDAAC6A|nr:HupE/UreJ family protein [Phenylobacterium sp.]HSV01884.1 HupE/UreJ family protein [Phenylobacterium sp.]
MRRRIFALALFLALGFAWAASAHEVRPAYLEIDQTGPAAYRITWKQPATGELALHLVPHLSGGWLEQPPADEYAAAGFVIRTWNVQAKTPGALEGQTLSVEGLANTITDVFVRIRPSDGRGFDTMLRPESPSLRVSLRSAAPVGVAAFVLLGIEHILTGADHLMFILGLVLMVRDRWTLLKTVSAFTIAHSLTLAAAALGRIAIPNELLDALIALSILFVAPEALRAQRGETSLAIRYPYVVAFAFGLLHGAGFASGLTSLGLARHDLLIALVLFNIGVEIGQLMFIASVFAVRRGLRLLVASWPRPLALAPAYAIGGFGACWAIQCSVAFFGLAS